MFRSSVASRDEKRRFQFSRQLSRLGVVSLTLSLSGTCLISSFCAAGAQTPSPGESTFPGSTKSDLTAAPASAPASESAADSTEAETQPQTPEVKSSVRRDLSAAADLMMDGKYSEAADLYRAVLNINSKETNALAGLGMALGRQFKLDAADEQFERLLSIDPNNPVAHCGKAMVLLNRLQSSSNTVIKSRTAMLKEAGKECNLALDADPRVVEAHYLLGRVYKEEGRNDRACQAFMGAIKLDPHYSNAYAQLGLVQVLLNKCPRQPKVSRKQFRSIQAIQLPILEWPRSRSSKTGLKLRLPN